MYTSGSTGKPKGVMIEHRNIIRLVKHSNYVPVHAFFTGCNDAPFSNAPKTSKVPASKLTAPVCAIRSHVADVSAV
jgi:acyl-CoA synthetase (AMP-forming)/AMP-acid ligase II